MKYFELVNTLELKYAPKIKNSRTKVEEKDIQSKSFSQLPQTQLWVLEPSERIIFTDIILFPFLLVSPNVKKIIEMHQADCCYRDIILLDEVSGKTKLYHLPMLYETNQLQIISRKRGDMEGWQKLREESSARRPVIKSNIFQVRDTLMQHTIISLELAESLLSNRTFGIGLREVELIMKVKDGPIKNES